MPIGQILGAGTSSARSTRAAAHVSGALSNPLRAACHAPRGQVPLALVSMTLPAGFRGIDAEGRTVSQRCSITGGRA